MKKYQSKKRSHNRYSLTDGWFGSGFHYSPDEALPITYASACVEVVAKHSKTGSRIFCEILDAFNRPNIQAVFSDIRSKLPHKNHRGYTFSQ